MKKTKMGEGRYSVGFIYFVKDKMSGLVKIGHTEQLERRLKNLANQLPGEIELLLAIKVKERLRAERSYQHHYHGKKAKNEWYDLTDMDVKDNKNGNYPAVVKECFIEEIPLSSIDLPFSTEKDDDDTQGKDE